jgi:hypothetical protein
MTIPARKKSSERNSSRWSGIKTHPCALYSCVASPQMHPDSTVDDGQMRPNRSQTPANILVSKPHASSKDRARHQSGRMYRRGTLQTPQYHQCNNKAKSLGPWHWTEDAASLRHRSRHPKLCSTTLARSHGLQPWKPSLPSHHHQ